MISGSESIDLYYLKYFIINNRRSPFDTTASSPVVVSPKISSDRNTIDKCCRTTAAITAAAAAGTATSGFTTSGTGTPPSSFTSSCQNTIQPTILATETVNMLIGRLAIILSLVGWRVKPDPGD